MDRRTRKFAGAGALGVSAVLAAAPGASAAGPSHTAVAARTVGPDARAAGAPVNAPREAVAPDYGTQKVRVGVDGTSGDAFPSGTSTVGTEITIVETGPNAPADKFTCNTVAGTPASTDVHDPTWCPDVSIGLARRKAVEAQNRQHRARPALHTGSGNDFSYSYQVGAGDTAVITQTTVENGLTIDSKSETIEPCTTDGPSFCSGADTDPTNYVLTTDVVFDDDGPLPTAVPDSVSTGAETPVDIDVTGNDSTGGVPQTDLAIASPPAHGGAFILPGAPSGGLSNGSSALPTTTVPAAGPAASGATASTIRYTPAAGFSGVDRFRYRLSTANGSSVATVTVHVSAGASSSASSPSSASTSISASTPTSSASPLADTGTDSSSLSEIALGLLVVGGVATVVGRRRRPLGRHVRGH